MTESKVYLLESKSGDLVEASLFDDIQDEHLELWSSTWAPLMRSFRESLDTFTPEDSHWNWKDKVSEWRNFLGYQFYSIVCSGELQGLMLTTDLYSARIQEQFGKPIVYVHLLSTAPWNRPELEPVPRYKGVGRILILCATQASIEIGYKGRVGLHSLPKAEVFYEKKCGFTRLGKDSSYYNLTYFELTQTQAESFRRNY